MGLMKSYRLFIHHTVDKLAKFATELQMPETPLLSTSAGLVWAGVGGRHQHEQKKKWILRRQVWRISCGPLIQCPTMPHSPAFQDLWVTS